MHKVQGQEGMDSWREQSPRLLQAGLQLLEEARRGRSQAGKEADVQVEAAARGIAGCWNRGAQEGQEQMMNWTLELKLRFINESSVLTLGKLDR